MTTCAHCEIVTTKRSLAVVASNATKTTNWGVMVEWDGRSHLSALAGTNLMAINTLQRAVVTGVTEPSSKSNRAR